MSPNTASARVSPKSLAACLSCSRARFARKSRISPSSVGSTPWPRLVNSAHWSSISSDRIDREAADWEMPIARGGVAERAELREHDRKPDFPQPQTFDVFAIAFNPRVGTVIVSIRHWANSSCQLASNKSSRPRTRAGVLWGSVAHWLWPRRFPFCAGLVRQPLRAIRRWDHRSGRRRFPVSCRARAARFRGRSGTATRWRKGGGRDGVVRSCPRTTALRLRRDNPTREEELPAARDRPGRLIPRWNPKLYSYSACCGFITHFPSDRDYARPPPSEGRPAREEFQTMNASTYEALSLISRGRRRDMGALTVPRASLRGLGMAALHAVPSTRAPGRARRGLVGARTRIHAIPQTGTPNWLWSGPYEIACGASGRDHGAKRNAVV